MLLAVAEKLLNDTIGASTAAQKRAARVEGQSLSLEIHGLGLRVHCRVREGRLKLSSDATAAASVQVCGPPLDLLGMLGPDSLRELRGSAVRLTGDPQLAEAFAELLRAARPELEEALAGWAGDIPAHAIAARLRAAAGWSARARRAIELDTAEYLQEESALLPGPRQLRAFCSAVDVLRDDVERAAARVERLGKSLPPRA